MDVSHKRPTVRNFGVYFAVIINKLLNEQTIRRWYYADTIVHM